MLRAYSLAALALVCSLPACASPGGGETSGSASSSGDCPAGGEGCPCAENNSCDLDLVCASLVCVSPGDASSGTSSSSASADDTTGPMTSDASASESSTGSATQPGPACGDGALDDGEDCDDGNIEPGDGCDGTCTREPWQHDGVAHDVPIVDLYGWELCGVDTYAGAAVPVDSFVDGCDKENLLIACSLAGSGKLSLAAHAPREDVLFPVNYEANERHEANNVSWYWSPGHGIIGFGPSENNVPCSTEGQDEQLCWQVEGDNFGFGARCGQQLGFTDLEAPMWRRLAYHR